MEVKINLSNKLFYVFVLVGVFVLLGVGVYAYGGTSPDVMGHSVGELEFPVCSDGEVLKSNGAAWECGTDTKTLTVSCSDSTNDICESGEFLQSVGHYSDWSAGPIASDNRVGLGQVRDGYWTRVCNKCYDSSASTRCSDKGLFRTDTSLIDYEIWHGKNWDCYKRTRTWVKAKCCTVSIS